jgi:hypothetical protein
MLGAGGPIVGGGSFDTKSVVGENNSLTSLVSSDLYRGIGVPPCQALEGCVKRSPIIIVL